MYSQWVIVPCKKHIRLHVKSLFREVLHSRSTYSTAELSCVKQPSPAKKKKEEKNWGVVGGGEKKNPTSLCFLHEIARVIRPIVYKYGPSGRNSITLSRKNR